MKSGVNMTALPDTSPNELADDIDDPGFEQKTVNGKKTYCCLSSGCGKIFKFKSEMERHLTIHSPQRPYACSFADCQKSFKRPDALSNHMRIHLEKNTFNCPKPGCSAQLCTKSALKYHLLKHEGEKIFKCTHPGCDKSFLTYNHLKQHTQATVYHQKVASLTPAPDHNILPLMPLFNPSSALLGKEDALASLYLNDQQHLMKTEPSLYANPESDRLLSQFLYNPCNRAMLLGQFDRNQGMNQNDALLGLMNSVMAENEQLKQRLNCSTHLLQNKLLRDLLSTEHGNADLSSINQAILKSDKK